LGGQATAQHTQQSGIKEWDMSSTSNRPSPETALKAETGWSVWPARLSCWREMTCNAPTAADEALGGPDWRRSRCRAMTNRHGGSCGCVNGARACWLGYGDVETDSRGRGDGCVGERVGMETASWWGARTTDAVREHAPWTLESYQPHYYYFSRSPNMRCGMVRFVVVCTWLCVSGAPGPRSVVRWEVGSRTQEGWNGMCGGLVEEYIKEPTSRSALRVALFYCASSMRRRRSGSIGLASACGVSDSRNLGDVELGLSFDRCWYQKTLSSGVVNDCCWCGSEQTFAECAKVESYTESLVVNCSQPVRQGQKVSST